MKIDRKIYERRDVITWQNICYRCCADCDDYDICADGCIKHEITCNQCDNDE